jgi:glycosyltransferase involved in cell wall biosynthesis
VTADGLSLDVNYTMFEATRVPDSWIREHRRHQLVVVPTASSRDAWLTSGLPVDKLRICPLGVDPDRFNPDVMPLDLTLSDGEPVSRYRSRFLNVSELGPRKNLSGLLRAWMLATRADDDAILIVKVGRISHAGLETLKTEIRNLERDLNRPLERAARVDLLFDQLSDRMMPSLYTSASHYISMSHGEGWDNAMIEAAASGLQLIAPDHSAYRAYLDEEIAWLIPSCEIPACIPGDPGLRRLFRGANWWQPDPGKAAGVIRAIVDGNAADKGNARATVSARFRWEQSAATLLEILDGVQRSRSG